MKTQLQTGEAAGPRHRVEDPGERDVLRAFVLKLVGDPALADDLGQEALLRAHRSEAGFRGEASRRTWLHVIALNVVRDHFRATARLPRQVSDPEILAALRSDTALEDEFIQREMATCIRGYVLSLPDRQRDAVALHDIAGLSHAEVAEALDISEGNSRTLLHRGRAALKLLLEENCELCFDDDVPCQPKGA